MPRFLALLLVPAAALALAGAAAAEPSKEPFSLTVSPARSVLPLGRHRGVETYTVTNDGSARQHLVVVLTEFRQTPEGRTEFVSGGRYDATSWLTASPKAFELAPGQARKVRIRVRVPRDAEPGDRQVGVLFKVPAQETSGSRNVAVSGAIGTTLYMRVPGQIRHDVWVDPLHVPFWADGGPVKITVRLRNAGNVHEDYIAPKSPLVATIRGHGRVTFPNFTLGRGAEITQEALWQDPPLFCICRVRIETTDRAGHPVVLEQRLIMFPLRLVAGILLAAVGLYLLTRRSVSARRRRSAARLEAARLQGAEQARRELGGRPRRVEPEPEPEPERVPVRVPEPEPEPEPEPVGVEAAPAAALPDAVARLPKADELPDWFVRVKAGGAEPTTKRRRTFW